MISFLRVLWCIPYSKTANNRTTGGNHEYNGGPGGPGTGFCSPGGGFLVLVAVVARLLPLRPPPGTTKTSTRTARTTVVLVIAPRCTIISRLRVQ